MPHVVGINDVFRLHARVREMPASRRVVSFVARPTSNSGHCQLRPEAGSGIYPAQSVVHTNAESGCPCYKLHEQRRKLRRDYNRSPRHRASCVSLVVPTVCLRNRVHFGSQSVGRTAALLAAEVSRILFSGTRPPASQPRRTPRHRRTSRSPDPEGHSAHEGRRPLRTPRRSEGLAPRTNAGTPPGAYHS